MSTEPRSLRLKARALTHPDWDSKITETIMKTTLSSQTIELQHYLLNRRRTQKEIAEHFGVDRKTVRRAIDKLGQFAMVSEEREGRNTVYFIPESDFNSSELTPIELAALVLSQEAITAGGIFRELRLSLKQGSRPSKKCARKCR